MARISTLIDDFSVGEVSPLTEAKISSDEFKDGMRECTNCIPDSHGPVVGRSGPEHIRPVSVPAGKSATIYEIPYSPTEYFFVILYDLVIEICDRTGAIIHTEATIFTGEDLHGADHDEHLSAAIISPSGKDLIILTGQHAPWIVKMSPPAVDGDPWTAVWEEIVFVAKPAVWVEGNYPTTGAWFQNRTWWGGCVDDPDTFWGSRSFEPYDMTLDDAGTVFDTNAIEFKISKHGRIRWIESARNLLLGTEKGEFICTSDTGVVTPSDIKVELQSAYGSKRMQPELIGNEVVYVTSDGRKLRSMWWKWVESGWVSLDATFTSEHMTKVGVASIGYSRNPHSMVYLLLSNGDLIACSYRREEDDDPIVGWHRITSDSMHFITMCVADDLGTSNVWAIVKSKNPDEDLYHLVKYRPHDYNDDDSIFLDNWTLVTDPNGTDEPNFAGKLFDTEIAVVADGFHIPDVMVEADGTIKLPIEAKEIYAGHPFEQRFVTMPLIAKGGSNEGTVGHQMKRWNKVFLRMLHSYMPKVNGVRPPERHAATNDDTAEPFIDTFVQITPGFGWDREGVLTIEQDLPFPMVVTGIYGEVAIEQI